MKALQHRVQMMIGRCVIAAINDDPKCQELQVELLADETIDAVEHFQGYGLSAHPRAGAEGVALSVGGLRSHAIVLAVGDRRYRMTGLAEGEVALHDDQGQSVHLTRDGIVITGKKLTVEVDDAIELTGASFKVTADTVDLASDDVGIGNGATLFAARKTDTATGGTVTGGSTKVRIA